MPSRTTPPAPARPHRGGSVLTPDTGLSFPEFVLLKASAGSGKTHALSLRFVQFLLSERVGGLTRNDLASILAITFTRNAAREMKARILGWLKACYFRDPREMSQVLEIVSLAPDRLPDRAGEAVDRILADYTDFQVATIDSFMAAIFKASAVDLGHAPDFEIVLEPRELIDYAFSRYLRRVSAGSADGELFAGVLDRLMADQPADLAFPWDPAPQVLDRLSLLYAKISAGSGDLKIESFAKDTAEVQARIVRAVEDMEALIEASALERNLRSHYNSRIVPAVGDRRFTALLGASFKTLPVKKPGRGEGNDSLETVREAWEALRILVDGYRSLYARGFFHPYLEVFRAFSGTLDLVKRVRGTVFIDDINRQLAGYIDRGIVPDIYFRLGDRVFHYLVDEFQDTSPVQWGNMVPLIENSLAQGGSLFVVGDTKQAIFGFRDADYRIMRDLESRVTGFDSAAASVVELPENYRCGERILDFVKRIFLQTAAADEGYAPIAGRSGLDSWAQEAAAGNKGAGFVRYLLLDKGADAGRPGAAEDPEGAPAGDERADGGDAVPAGDDGPEKPRVQELVRELAARGWSYADIAVLTYKNENVARVSSWLNEERIPFIPYSSLDIRERKVIVEVLSFLEFLDSPPDDLSFAAFLSGGLFGGALARDDAAPPAGEWDRFLFAHRNAADRPLYGAFRDGYPGLWDRYFEPYFRTVGYYPLYDLVTQIYRGFGVFDLFPGEEASFVKLLEVIKDFEGAGRNDLRAFLEITRNGEGGASDWTIDVPSDIPAVKVMSIHKAKGLGFPVVILLLYGEPWRPPDLYVSRKEDGVRVYKINAALAEADPELSALYAETKARDRADRMNALYVALTRARAELYVVGVKGKRDTYPFDLVGGESWASAEAPPPARPRLGRPAVPPAETHRFRGPFELPPNRRESLNYGAVRRGEIAHAILAGLEFVERGFAEAVAAVVGQVRPPETEMALWRETEEAVAGYFAASPAAELFAKREGRRILREADFCDAEGRAVRMDRVVIDPEGVTVVDFKTGFDPDAVRRAARAEADREQVRAYMRVLGEALPGRPVRGFLAFIDEGRFEAVE